MTQARNEPKDILPPGVNETSGTIEVDIESLGGLRKKGTSTQYGAFTVYSDEPPSLGEPSQDPPPMVYFAWAVAF